MTDFAIGAALPRGDLAAWQEATGRKLPGDPVPVSVSLRIGRMTFATAETTDAACGLPKGAGPILKRAIAGKPERRRKGLGPPGASRAKNPQWQMAEYRAAMMRRNHHEQKAA